MADVFVIFAVTLLSLAAGAGLLAQLGVAVWWAMVGSLAVYAALLSLHLFARRQLAALDQAATDRLQADIDALMPEGEDLPQHDFDGDFRTDFEPRERTSLLGDSLHSRWNIGPAEDRAEASHALPEPRDTELFDFRPLRAPSLALPDTGPSAEVAPATRAEPASSAGEPPAEVNVEYIQDLIKKLADELNGPVQAPLPDEKAAQAIAGDPEGMIGRSVSALETTARVMRTPPSARRCCSSRSRRSPRAAPVISRSACDC
jgi:hypothetical protein